MVAKVFLLCFVGALLSGFECKGGHGGHGHGGHGHGGHGHGHSGHGHYSHGYSNHGHASTHGGPSSIDSYPQSNGLSETIYELPSAQNTQSDSQSTGSLPDLPSLNWFTRPTSGSPGEHPFLPPLPSSKEIDEMVDKFMHSVYSTFPPGLSDGKDNTWKKAISNPTWKPFLPATDANVVSSTTGYDTKDVPSTHSEDEMSEEHRKDLSKIDSKLSPETTTADPEMPSKETLRAWLRNPPWYSSIFIGV